MHTNRTILQTSQAHFGHGILKYSHGSSHAKVGQLGNPVGIDETVAAGHVPVHKVIDRQKKPLTYILKLRARTDESGCDSAEDMHIQGSIIRTGERI